MAMKALRCPQCGSELELDDSKDFGFCSSCGTKIMLHETVEMKHSGAVSMKMDNSMQGNNRISLGNRAFKADNYEEAYKYFTQGLEDVPDSFIALYRKGICAVYLSPEDDIRVRELITGCEAALDTFNERYDRAKEAGDKKTLDEFDGIVGQYDNDVETLGRKILGRTANYNTRCRNQNEAAVQAARWCEAALVLNAVSKYIIDDDIQEKMLADAIERCDAWLRHDSAKEIMYYVNTTTNKKGKSTDNFSVYRMADSYRNTIEEARHDMADTYNNMASRKERETSLRGSLNEITQEESRLRELMTNAESEYSAAKDAFWAANPELTALRNKKKNLSWISVGIGAAVLILGIVLCKSMGIIMPAIGVLVFAASFFAKKKISAKSLEKLEKELFTDDVKALGEAKMKATDEWCRKYEERKEKESALSSFEASKK